MRKIFRQLTNAEKEQIAVEFHLKTLEAMSKKFNVSKTTIHQVVTNFFKDKVIDVTGLSVTEIMDKYNVTMGKAVTLQLKFSRPLAGSLYFGMDKEAVYSSESDMIIPEYNFEGLSEEEKIIFTTLA